MLAKLSLSKLGAAKLGLGLLLLNEIRGVCVVAAILTTMWRHHHG